MKTPTLLFLALFAVAPVAARAEFEGDAPDTVDEQVDAFGYSCQAYAARHHNTKIGGGLYTPWEYGDTEEEARDAALSACTTYGSGCSIARCKQVERIREAAPANYRCLATGLHDIGGRSSSSHTIYSHGFGATEAEASEAAESKCRAIARGCQIVNCREL